MHLFSYIDVAHFRKINQFTVSERVESYITTPVFKYCNGIVPSYINDIFKPQYNRYNTRSQMALDIPLRKTNTGQQTSFPGPKICTKTSRSTKNVKTTTSFTHALTREILN